MASSIFTAVSATVMPHLRYNNLHDVNVARGHVADESHNVERGGGGVGLWVEPRERLSVMMDTRVTMSSAERSATTISSAVSSAEVAPSVSLVRVGVVARAFVVERGGGAVGVGVGVVARAFVVERGGGAVGVVVGVVARAFVVVVAVVVGGVLENGEERPVPHHGEEALGWLWWRPFDEELWQGSIGSLIGPE